MEQVQVSILSERRVIAPYGLAGGGNGRTGRNYLMRKTKDGKYRTINFGGKNSTIAYQGDCVRIETPGDRGWGLAGKIPPVIETQNAPILIAGGSLGNYIAT